MNSNIIQAILNNNYIYLHFIFLFIHLINVLLDEIISKKNKHNKNYEQSSKNNIKTMLGVICFIIIVFVFLELFFSVKIFNIIFMSVNTSYLIYILIICPLFNIKLSYSFKEDSTIVASFLFVEIFCVEALSKYENLVNITNNEYLMQIIIIINIFTRLLLISYFIILSFYNIIKNFNILIMENLNAIVTKEIEKIDNKYNFEYLDNLTNNEKNYIVKVFLFFYKSILWVLMVLIIRGFLFSMQTIYKFISNFFKNDNNNVFYILSKISLIISLFTTYCIIKLSSYFNIGIISIFELIISALVIPIILEMLLSKKQ